MKDTLYQDEELLIGGFGKFSVRQKNGVEKEILKPEKIWFCLLAKFWY